MLTLTVSADGAVPLAHRLLDGNTTDDQTHIATWDGLVELVGRPDFLYEIAETVQESFRQEKRGRPGANTRYRRTEKTVLTLSFRVHDENVAYDAATDGCFPLVSNDRDLTDPEILAAYRYQPNLENRHHQFKTVLQAAPITLKSPSRIEGLACCEFIALLTQCLIERELRAAMARENISALAPYHEDRPSKAPTAARVFDLFTDTARHHLTLLDVPHDAYQSTTTDP